MKHKFARVVDFKPVKDYILDVVFDDGTSQRIDFFPVLTGELFEPLQNNQFFAQVSIDPESGTLVWPNGADFDPDMLHDWDTLKEAFQEQISAMVEKC
jgi:hypothetical protein